MKSILISSLAFPVLCLTCTSVQGQEAPAAPAPAAPAAAPAAGDKSEKPLPPKGRMDVDESSKKQVPEDLLDDEHVQEEAGVSELTTPSIRKIFEDLESLGSLPYDTLKRPLPATVPADRSLVALNLGLLIGDGFLAVQSEKIGDFEEIGRMILKFAKVLGAGARVKERVKSILESSDSAVGDLDWKELKKQLSTTQREVKHEMVLLRDIDMVHLVSLGGWIRGLQSCSKTSLEPFDADKAKVMARHDVAAYYVAVIDELPPASQKLPLIGEIRTRLVEIEKMVNLPEGRPLSKEEVAKLNTMAEEIMTLCGKY
jgi:hypothetical protein